jgi:hypothetical protein
MSTAKYSQRPERRELLPSYVRLKHKYSLANIISKSLLKDQDLSVGKLGGRKNFKPVFSKIYDPLPEGRPDLHFLHF